MVSSSLFLHVVYRVAAFPQFAIVEQLSQRFRLRGTPFCFFTVGFCSSSGTSGQKLDIDTDWYLSSVIIDDYECKHNTEQ